MRLLHVHIDGYRNLRNVEVNFDNNSLTTVVIGQNGSGKSNLIEAIVEVFRAHSLKNTNKITFEYLIRYTIGDWVVTLQGSGSKGRHDAYVDSKSNGPISGKFREAPEYALPDLVFGYYSGTGRKLEKLFDAHQSRYYSIINKERDDLEYEAAQNDRRLFYCRPVHGVFALLAYLAKPATDSDVKKLLTEKLGITGFHSALAHFKEPSWFTGSKAAAERETANLWGAHGPAGKCARALKAAAFHPLALQGAVVEDYRRKASKEAQLACFLRNEAALNDFAANYKSDKDMFAALEAADISDLFREMIVWVTRKNDASGDISFSDLSDGERQLLMVLGLIRVSRGKEALFLLDEPDTHLNPAWQLTYLDLIKEWTEIVADEDKCQIVMTSHNPLTIAALTRKEVRVMNTEESGDVTVKEPYADPRGMGFTSTLTEIFGLPTTLDPDTQKQIDDRNTLAQINQRTADQEKQLIAINDKLNRLGFMNESREPLYQDFLKAWQDVRYADKPPLTPDLIEKRRLAMQSLVKSLSLPQEGAH